MPGVSGKPGNVGEPGLPVCIDYNKKLFFLMPLIKSEHQNEYYCSPHSLL